MEMLFWAVGILGGGTLVSVAGACLVRRWATHEKLEGHKEVAGFLYSVIGAVYAVVLALAVVGLWDEFREAQAIADREGNKVLDLLRLSEALSQDARKEAHPLLHAYVTQVVTVEWPAMDRGQVIGRSREIDRLWEWLQSRPPAGDREGILWGKMVDALVDLNENRQGRLTAARVGLPRAMWGVLLAGSVLTIGFSYFFGVRSGRAHVALTAALGMSMMLQIFLLVVLERPFSGALKVEPLRFHQLWAGE